MTAQQIQRVAFLVGHHHTLHEIDGLDYQILIEADYLVNADESQYSRESIRAFLTNHFKTQTGKDMLLSLFPGIGLAEK